MCLAVQEELCSYLNDNLLESWWKLYDYQRSLHSAYLLWNYPHQYSERCNGPLTLSWWTMFSSWWITGSWLYLLSQTHVWSCLSSDWKSSKVRLMYQRLCKYTRIIHFTYEFIIILLVSTPMLALLGHNSQHVVAGIIFVVLWLSNIILVIAQLDLTRATDLTFFSCYYRENLPGEAQFLQIHNESGHILRDEETEKQNFPHRD